MFVLSSVITSSFLGSYTVEEIDRERTLAVYVLIPKLAESES